MSRLIPPLESVQAGASALAYPRNGVPRNQARPDSRDGAQVTTEAQQLLDAVFAGTLNLDADANQAKAPAATDSEAGIPANTTTEQAAGAQATQDDEKPAPIASKSGEYTIPYEKLTSARTERDHYKAEAAQLREQLASFW